MHNFEHWAEERTRAVSFSSFSKGTRANVIKDFIKKELGDVIGVEDIYTYDERTTKGMARFETLDGMWQYMGSEAGRQKHKFQGRRIYTDIPKEGDDAKRERAVRKTVHLIIKHSGWDGEEIKKGLDISYRQGYVWKGDAQLADWDKKERKMTLMGEAAGYAAELKTLIAE